MNQVNILVEGYTEKDFVNKILRKYLLENHFIFATAIIVSTKKEPSGKKYKGGLSNWNYSRFLDDLEKLIQTSDKILVTTLIDYYGYPSKLPGNKDSLTGTGIQKVQLLENALDDHFGNPPNFIPYIQLHEFEALLFSDSTDYELVFESRELTQINSIIAKFVNPEDINDSPQTAPSKRILSIKKDYAKSIDGQNLAELTGIPKMMGKCPHFKNWVESIVNYFSKQI